MASVASDEYLKSHLAVLLVCVCSAEEAKGELTVTVNIECFLMKGFQASGELMEAVRALDYEAQYKVCEAFYKLSNSFDWSDMLMFQRFEESFTMIDAENLEEHFVGLHWAVNDMDNFLYETDVYSPEEFYKVVREMEGSLGLM